MIKNSVNTPFDNAVATGLAATLNLKPTLDSPGQPGSNADSGVSQRVTPMELPINNLHHGTPDAGHQVPTDKFVKN